MSPHRSDRLIRHSLLLLAASQATNITNFIFQIFMVRILSSVEYGSLASMLAFLMIILTPLTALNNSMAYYSARLVEEGRSGAIIPFMRHWLVKVSFVVIVLMVIGAVFCPAVTSFFDLQRKTTFFITIVVLSLSFYGPIVGGVLQGGQAFGWLAVTGVSSGFLRLIGGVTLVLLFGHISDWAIAGHGVGMLAGLIIGAAGVYLVFRGHAPVRAGKNVAAYFLGTLTVLAGFSVMMSADVLIVKHFFAPEESGLFAQVATISRAIIFLPMPITGALFPKVVAAGTADARHKRLLFRGILLAGGIILAATGACSLVPQLPLWIIHVAPSESTFALLRYMLLAMSPLSLAYIVMNYHLAQNRFKILFLLPVCAFFYLAGVAIWHENVGQIIAVMAAVNSAGLIILLFGLPWKIFKADVHGVSAGKC